MGQNETQLGSMALDQETDFLTDGQLHGVGVPGRGVDVEDRSNGQAHRQGRPGNVIGY